MTDKTLITGFVKPLRWESWQQGISRAESIFGTYHTWEGYWRPPYRIGGLAAENPEAAAEADYEKRVLSLLEIVKVESDHG